MFGLKVFRSQIPVLRFQNIRELSQLQTVKERPKEELRVKKTSNTSAVQSGSTKTEENPLMNVGDVKNKIDQLSMNSKDNFLIEFRNRKPSYDQLFEYKLEQKPMPKSFDKTYFVSEDFKIWLHKKYDLSFESFKSWARRYIRNNNIESQEYNIRRHGILGPDLATAHFVTNRGGKARFKHDPDKWIRDNRTLPNVFDKKYRLLSLDASNINLIYEGLDNLILLMELEELHLCNNLLDDFGCDKLARMFRNSKALAYLDISGNKNITHRGVEALYKIPSLKYLIIKNTKAAEYPFIELLCKMFYEVLPECKIIYK